MAEALAMLEQAWTDLGAPIARLVLPGISSNEVRAGLASVGLTAPDELITWFAWHNGFDMSERRPYREVAFAPSGWSLLSLDRAIEAYKFGQEIWSDGADVLGEHGWTPQWFPIAESVGADMLVVSCAGPPEAPARVTTIHKEGREELPPLPSLRDAIVLLLRLIDEGGYRCDAAGWVGNQSALGSQPIF